MRPNVDLSVDFCGVKFKNPFMLSSSPVANSAEMIGRAFDAGWAGVAYKTIAGDKVKIVHPSPRMAGYDSGSHRLIGLQNVEQISDRSMSDNLRDITYLKKHWPDHPIMASIMGFSGPEWVQLAKAATDAGSDLLELNLSCPHMAVEGSGQKVGQNEDLVRHFTELVRNATSLPVVVKLTPNITDMTVPARFAKLGGADGIAAINTVAGIAGLQLDTLVPTLNVFGRGSISGYSGPAIKPIGLRFIADMAKDPDLRLPLSGIGGIETWVDALEYLLLGATTIQVTTGIIHYGYGIVEDMIEGLSDYMAARGIAHVADLVGKSLPTLGGTDAFDISRQGIASYDLDRCVGCGQCYVVCRDSGGKALQWEAETRRPQLDDNKCLSCMVCSFVCPVEGLITFREMPAGWEREKTLTLG
jgi:dihydropyrimidine dehydrogenase (NAD+) subunit PreA